MDEENDSEKDDDVFHAIGILYDLLKCKSKCHHLARSTVDE